MVNAKRKSCRTGFHKVVHTFYLAAKIFRVDIGPEDLGNAISKRELAFVNSVLDSDEN